MSTTDAVGERAAVETTDGTRAGSDERTDTDALAAAVGDLPPSAKLVAKVLQYNGTLTQSELAERTLLPARTVRYALGRLEEVDVVESRFSFADARKRLYTLTV